MLRWLVLAPGVALWAGCGSGSDSAAPHGAVPWNYVDSEEDPPARLSASEVAASVDRWLPALAAVDPEMLAADLDDLAGSLTGCGVYEYDDPTYGWTRTWYGDGDCGEGGVDGFVYELSFPLDEAYYPGISGYYDYTLWTADVWAPGLHLYGDANWGVQDYSYTDGTAVTVRWVDGDVRCSEGAPDWFIGDAAPSTTWYTVDWPDGTTTATLQGGADVPDSAIDAVWVSYVSVDAACTSASGTFTVHDAAGWYALAVDGVEGDCRVCGAVTDPTGADLGRACVDAASLLALGGA